MLPPPASPAVKSKSGWTLRVPREIALTMLRNNIGGLLAIFLFNWFFPIYPQMKALLLPTPWRDQFHTVELALLSLFFGSNIMVALVSIRYPRPPYPPLRTPTKLPSKVTPVRRPIKGLGTSATNNLSGANRSISSSGYASTPGSARSRMLDFSIPSSIGTPLPLNQSGSTSLSASGSANSSPLAAYRGRHPRQSGQPIDTRILCDLTATDDEQY
ncbi:hypothetical protein BU17DRAFT_92954 [Hysterangium stoloniferum]|nr:hypothetical protein BU17DRAFT_92954 [Hysterangium stoloniferum]